MVRGSELKRKAGPKLIFFDLVSFSIKYSDMNAPQTQTIKAKVPPQKGAAPHRQYAKEDRTTQTGVIALSICQ